MTPKQAQQVAADAGLNLYYDRKLRLWTLSTDDLSVLTEEGETAIHYPPFRFQQLLPNWTQHIADLTAHLGE